MSGLDLSGVNLRDGAIVSVVARGLDLRVATLDGGALGGDFSEADFRGASMQNVMVALTLFYHARLDGVDLRTIRGADGAIWAGASLEGANLEAVSFRGPGGRIARSTPAHPLDAAYGGVDFTGANLRRARVARARLSACRLRNVDLSEADLTAAHLSNADLSNANLRGAILDRAEALGTDFRGADLTGASIRRVRFDQATLEGATWVDGRVCGAGSVGRCRR